jgi:excinuclease ABC subunit B
VLSLSEKALSREIKQLEKQMLEHARNLEFEQAAQVRDRLARLKEQVFGSDGSGRVGPLVAGRAA